MACLSFCVHNAHVILKPFTVLLLDLCLVSPLSAENNKIIIKTTTKKSAVICCSFLVLQYLVQ